MLAVATWPHGCVAILADEATLFRKLRTSYDARPGRILRAAPQVMSLSPKCITVTATTSCRTRTTEFSRRGRRMGRGPGPDVRAAPVGCNASFGQSVGLDSKELAHHRIF